MLKGFREKIGDSLLILRESLKSFQKNNNFEKSAALAYYGFFALIPLLLLVVYLLGNYIISSEAATKGIESLTSQLFPKFSGIITKEVYSLSQHKGVWGVLSIIALFWLITPLAGALRSAFFRIFKADEEIPFLKAKLLDALAVLVILILFVFLVASEIFYSMIISTFFKKLPLFLDIINIVVPLVITTVFVSFFHLAFSPVKLRFSYLLAGSLIIAILWSIMRPIFSLFLTFNPHYGFAFGSLKAIFVLFVWVYYSFSVILFGTEVMANVRREDTLLLKKVFFNTSISDKVHRRLMKKFGKSYDLEEIIFREGDRGRDMFFILSGSVTLSKNEQILRVMKQGEYFGEMSMLLNAPRTATATVAEPDTQLVIISQDNFETILRENPRIVLSLLKEMALRLKMTDEYI
ncbi:MAG: YhjD/YihY/BrkB family envelope integrity protein [Nitrospirota bacterium]